MTSPLLPLKLALGARLVLERRGLLRAIPPPDPLTERAGCAEPWFRKGLLDYGFSRLARLSGSVSAALAAELLLEELGGGPVRLVYLDVGSRSSPARPGGFIVIKEAEVVVETGSSSREELRHPVLKPFGPLLPLPGGRRAERLRQAARYIAELARVYVHLRSAASSAAATIVFKHGPMVELLPVYLNPVYTADERVYGTVLRYAGLEHNVSEKLLDASMTPQGVNAGLLALNLLACIAGVVATIPVFAAGVVEDTSRSRHLVSQLIYESILAARTLLDHSRAPVTHETLHAVLAEFLREGGDALRDVLEACGFEDDSRDDEEVLRELIARLGSRALRWGHLSLPALLVDERYTAAAVYQESSVLEVDDAAVMLTVAFLRGSAVTAPVPNAALRGLLLRASVERMGGSTREARLVSRLADALTHIYAYVVPGPPPRCRELSSLAERLGVKPSMLANLVRAKLPLRVDTIVATDRLSAAADVLVGVAALVQLEASVTAYGLPAGIVRADVASRVSLNEALILAELARQLEGRLVPYGLVLRHWPRRGYTL